MNRVFTDLMKFLCCILVFVHHFFLKSPFVSMFGYIACSIFFFLSAYGVSKSLGRKNMGLMSFGKHRLLRIYKPLLLVNVVFLACTSMLCVGYFCIPIFGVFCDKITYIYDFGIDKIVKYIIGLHKIDSVTWFLDILLVSYLLVWGILQLRKTLTRNFAIIGGYSLYLIGCVIFPPSYYVVDTIGICFGLLFMVNEKRILAFVHKMNNRYVCVSIALSIFLLLWLDYSYQDILLGRYIKCLAFAVSALSMVFLVLLGSMINIKANKLIAKLSGISYFVYLTHVKVANIVYYLGGQAYFFISLAMTLVVSFVLYEINKKIVLK